MLIAVGTALPDYRVKASASPLVANNLIHDDEYARRHGFRGALVPGATVYAYMVHSLVGLLGRDWLRQGSAEVRFVLPVYEGEEIRTAGILSSITREGMLCIDFQAINSRGVTSAAGAAMLPPHPPTPAPCLSDYPAGRQAAGRAITLQSLRIGEILRPVKSDFTRQAHWAYCQKILRDHHPLFQEIVHPGWLLSQANLVLSENYALPAWIHVSSAVQNFALQAEECIVETRGKVEDKFEHKGNHYVVLNLALFAGKSCLQTIIHTVIFRIAPRAA